MDPSNHFPEAFDKGHTLEYIQTIVYSKYKSEL